MPKDKPEIRFAGYTDAWEKRPLKKLIKEFSTKSKKENEYKVLSSTNTGMEVRDGRVSGSSNLGYKIIDDGDLVLSPQNLWLGNININNIGTGLVSPSYKTFKFINVSSLFLKPQLRKQRMLEEYKNASTQGASVVRRNLDMNAFYQIEISIPNTFEQKKVGNLFAALDQLITVNQRKVDLLKELKKGFLQKMFPKTGEDKPEIRFAGYTDVWEKRKLSSQYKKITEKNDLSFKTNKIISVANMYYKSDSAKSDDNYMKTYNVFRIGDIAFEGHKSNSYAYGRFVENTIGDGIVSHIFDVFRPIRDYDLQYWKYAIQYEPIMGRLLMKSTTKSTMMNNLVAKDFLKKELRIPKLNEQQKIGGLFQKLDKLITVNQRRVDLLKQEKKALLQKMFV